jgi:hypothetical protein
MLLMVGLARGSPMGEWQELSPGDRGFTVQVPGAPNEFKKTISGQEVVIYEVPLAAMGAKFVVSYSRIPAGAVVAGTEDKRLDNARDGAVASSKGKLKQEKSLLLDQFPGRELTIQIDDKTSVLLRLYAVKNVLYQTAVIGPPDALASPEAKKFFASFKLKAP